MDYLRPFPARVNTAQGRYKEWSRCADGNNTHPQALLLPGRYRASIGGTVTAQLRFLLSTPLLDMKHDAANCFMRDSICDCDGAKGFLLLDHTMYYCWPLISGNAVFG